MKTYCYHTRTVAGVKISGGMTHANSMEEAALRVIKQNKLETATRYKNSGFEQYHLERNGEQVFLYISVHPENLPKRS